MMYRIGEFSKITHLTVKALRYYDAAGILAPSHRGENDYRYYSEEDYKTALKIRLLRSLDFSISEIKDVIAADERDFPVYIREKKLNIEKRIREERALIKKLEAYIQPEEVHEMKKDYPIEFVELEPVRVASYRFKGHYSDVGKYIGDMYKEIKGRPDGAPFNCYYDEDYNECADIELCIPTKAPVKEKLTTVRILPKIKAISTLHHGSYETLGDAYKAIIDYTASNNLKMLTPSREIYLKGPGMVFKGNENSYITQILVPIETM